MEGCGIEFFIGNVDKLKIFTYLKWKSRHNMIKEVAFPSKRHKSWYLYFLLVHLLYSHRQLCSHQSIMKYQTFDRPNFFTIMTYKSQFWHMHARLVKFFAFKRVALPSYALKTSHMKIDHLQNVNNISW